MSEAKNDRPEQPYYGISGIASERVMPEAKTKQQELPSDKQPGDEISIHKEKYFPTPAPDKWERRSFGAPARETDRLRTNAEIETDRDMDKPLEQLACDIHETYLRWEQLNAVPTKVSLMKEPSHLVLYALARTASMHAKITLNNDKLGVENIKLQQKIEKLTKVLIRLTGGIVLLTIALLIKEFI